MSKMEIEKYLERINYKGIVEPATELLNALQKLHLLSVPFENLDIHYKIPIELNLLFTIKKNCSVDDVNKKNFANESLTHRMSLHNEQFAVFSELNKYHQFAIFHKRRSKNATFLSRDAISSPQDSISLIRDAISLPGDVISFT